MTHLKPPPILPDDEFLRLPGLFRRWELKDVIAAGPDFHFEEAGKLADGSQLFAVYKREHNHEED